LQKLPLPWLKPENEVLSRNFEPGQLAPWLAECGVNGSVVVQAAHDEAETAWLLGLAQEHSFIKGVVGWVDLTAPDLGERLARFKAGGPFCGIRAPLLQEANGVTGLDRAVLPGLQMLAEHDLSCDLLVNAARLKYFTGLFETAPDIRWVINHLGQPPLKGGDMAGWQTAMRQAARRPNVFCKVSGMVTLADPAKDFEEQVRPVFESVLEYFGPGRLLWGSDWPVSLQAANYRQVHDRLAGLVARLSETEQAAIWAGTACKVYKIKA
jgi:L-fuconolactonase